MRTEDVGGDGGRARWSTVGVSQGARRKQGGWYIDVERVEDGDPTKDARQTPAPVRLGASRAEH